MGQYRTDVNPAPVVMNSGDQPGFVPANIEHCHVAYLVCTWKVGA